MAFCLLVARTIARFDDVSLYTGYIFPFSLPVLSDKAQKISSRANLDFHADRAETCELLKRRRGDVREELEGTALPVRFIGISRSAVEHLRNRLLSGRGLDLTV